MTVNPGTRKIGSVKTKIAQREKSGVSDETDKKRICMDWTVIRFWGKEILKNIDECIRVIEETVFEKQMKNPDDIQHRYSN